MTRSCSACRWQAKNPADITGRQLICRRFPPTPVVLMDNRGGAGLQGFHPPVVSDHFCGEFSLVEVANAA